VRPAISKASRCCFATAGHADLAVRSKIQLPRRSYVSNAPLPANPPLAFPPGAFAKLLLRSLGIEVASHVVRVAVSSLTATPRGTKSRTRERGRSRSSPVVDPVRKRYERRSGCPSKAGDTVNGIFEVVAHAFRPASAPTPIGMSASTASLPGRS